MTEPILPPSGGSAAPPATAASLTDRIELIYTFVRIVEAGSLSAAALQIGASQPTVSRRLQQLERSLGLRLLQRTTHAMKLTEDGERCYERAKVLLADWGAFEADLRGTAAAAEGHLRVVVPHVFGQQHLVRPMAEFMHSHPRVTIEWLLHDRTPEFVAEGVDCAIHVGAVSDPTAVAIRMASVPRIIVAAPSLLRGRAAPAHAADLDALPWLAPLKFYRKDIILTHTGDGASHRCQFRARMTTDSLFALRSAAVLGLGVCVTSAWMVADELASGQLLQLLPDWQPEPLPVFITYPYARFYPAKLRRFVDTMRAALPAAMGMPAEQSEQRFP